MAEESMLLIRAEPEILTNGLIDALMEAVVLPPDARARSAAIRCMLEEITTALKSLARTGPAGRLRYRRRGGELAAVGHRRPRSRTQNDDPRRTGGYRWPQDSGPPGAGG